jgi:aldehyde dehydrogenase (NAD+)
VTPRGIPGGELADGFYVEPAVFGDVDPGSEPGQVELFGPVLSLMRFHTEEQALVIVNGASPVVGCELPFGRVGISGFGRERGLEGLLEFVRTEEVAVV